MREPEEEQEGRDEREQQEEYDRARQDMTELERTCMWGVLFRMGRLKTFGTVFNLRSLIIWSQVLRGYLVLEVT